MEGKGEQALHQHAMRWAQMGVLDIVSSCEEDGAIAGSTSGWLLSVQVSLEPLCSVWAGRAVSGISLPSHPGGCLCLSPLLDLLLPVFSCFLLSWLLFLYCCPSQVFRACVGMKMSLLDPHFDWQYLCYWLLAATLTGEKSEAVLILHRLSWTVCFSSSKAYGISFLGVLKFTITLLGMGVFSPIVLGLNRLF